MAEGSKILPRRTCIDLSELEADKVKGHTLTSESDLTGRPDSVVSGEEELSGMTSGCSVRKDRSHDGFILQHQRDTERKEMSEETPPFAGCSVVIDSALFQQWRQTGYEQGLTSDSKIAAFLLSRYEESRTPASESSALCSSCQTPLTLVCLTCNPAQARYQDNALPPPAVCREDGGDSPHLGNDHDSDNEAPSAVNPSDGQLLLAESLSTDDRLLLEKGAVGVAAALRACTREAGRTDSKESGENNISGSKKMDEKISKCYVKIADIGLECSVKMLQKKGLLTAVKAGKPKHAKSRNHRRAVQKKGLLTAGKAGKPKPAESRNHRRAVQHYKTKGEKNKVNASRVGKQTESQPQDDEPAEERFKQSELQQDHEPMEETSAVQKMRDQRRKESLPQILSENGAMEEEKLFKCSVCSEAFKDRSSHHTHEQQHDVENRKLFNCEQCPVEDGKVSMCEQCPATDRKLFKCEQCSATFRSRGNLVAHCRKHTGEKPFCCEVCGKSFARSTTLDQHRRVHSDDRPYKCEECGEAFRQRGMVIVHRRKVHTQERPFSCSVCGASFLVKGHLQVHMQSHTDLRPYLCEECGSSFKHKGILETHRMIHTGVRPFTCDICCKAFYRQVDVRAHRKSHFDVRDIICTVCGAGFGTNSRLKRHMQRHTGFRPFPCSKCGKNFASNSELKVHLRIHSGDKPYACDVCGRRFQTMGNMKKHRGNRHKHAPPYVPSAAGTGGNRQEGHNNKVMMLPPDPKSNLMQSSSPKTDPLPPSGPRTDLIPSSSPKTDLIPSSGPRTDLIPS